MMSGTKKTTKWLLCYHSGLASRGNVGCELSCHDVPVRTSRSTVRMYRPCRLPREAVARMYQAVWGGGFTSDACRMASFVQAISGKCLADVRMSFLIGGYAAPNLGTSRITAPSSIKNHMQHCFLQHHIMSWNEAEATDEAIFGGGTLKYYSLNFGFRQLIAGGGLRGRGAAAAGPSPRSSSGVPRSPRAPAAAAS